MPDLKSLAKQESTFPCNNGVIFYYSSFFDGAWRKMACAIKTGNAATRCCVAITLELENAYR